MHRATEEGATMHDKSGTEICCARSGAGNNAAIAPFFHSKLFQIVENCLIGL
jgi:hypothetical protein